MGLPISNETISYRQVELPSTKKIGIRGWKLKEEKELLFAIEGQSDDTAIRKEVVAMISKCVDNQETFKTLSNVDYIFLLIELRKISKGNTVEFTYKCTNDKFELFSEVNLIKDIKVKKYTGKKVTINETKSINLKEVSFLDFDDLKSKYTKITEYNYHFVLKSIDSIIDNGVVYTEFTQEELTKYIDELTSSEFRLLSTAIDESLATIEISKKITCGRCKTEMDVEFGDLYFFFAF